MKILLAVNMYTKIDDGRFYNFHINLTSPPPPFSGSRYAWEMENRN